MNNTKTTSYILILGIIILGTFTYVITLNIFENNSSTNPLFSKTDEEVDAQIESTEVIDNKLVITTTGDAKELCIKTTKSKPQENALCWIKVENNIVTTSTYSYKTYYIWIKDSNNKISDYKKYNS